MGEEVQLEKSLSYKSILLISINSIMGTGIFFLPALGAKVSGPASLLAWAAMSFVAIYTSMCFAELTSMFPKAGGIYEFAKQAFGRFMSFFIGWTTIIVGYITIAMLIIGAIRYLLPPDSTGGFFVLLIAMVFIVLFNIIAYTGLKTSATMLIAFAFITLGTILSLTIPGLWKIQENFSNLIPFFPFGGSLMIVGILLTVFTIAETFFGWETATFLAGETKDGERVVPKALFHSTIFISVIAFLFVLSSLLTIHWETFGQSVRPLYDLSVELYGSGVAPIFSILIYLSIIGSVAGWIVSAPRLILTLAEDGLFIKQLARISPKFKTPSYAIVFQTILIIVFLFAGFGQYETLLEMLIPLVLVLYSFIMVILLILRRKLPNQKRYFVAPFGCVGPILMILAFMTMVGVWVYESHNAWNLIKLGGSFILVGFPLYFLIELYNNPRFSQRIKDMTAYYTYFLENLFIPKKVQEEILSYLGNIKGRTILEYGSSVGTLTRHLIYSVGKRGKVVCINNSHTELKILEKRVREPKWKTFERIKGELNIIHHPQYHSQVHMAISQVDAIVSLDTLSGMDNPVPILRQLADIVPELGRVCFFDFGDFFRLIPNQHWLSDPVKTKEVFRKAGFQVRVRRRKSLFWNYIFIYGVRSDKPVTIV